MTPAGKRDRRVIFQRYTATQADSGEEVQAWAALGTPQKVRVYYGNGSERREAGREDGSQSANFNCHACETTKQVAIRDRIVMDGENWDVVGISPIGRREIEFTATREL